MELNWHDTILRAWYLAAERQTAPKFRVTIDCDGKTTTARLLVDGEEVKRTHAYLAPDDKFSLAVGAHLALDRLLPLKSKEAGK